MTVPQSFRPEPEPQGIDWPELLRLAARVGVSVYRPNADGYVERVTR